MIPFCQLATLPQHLLSPEQFEGCHLPLIFSHILFLPLSLSLSLCLSLSLSVCPTSLFSFPQGHLSEGYGKLCSIYLKLLITKMEFHIKVSGQMCVLCLFVCVCVCTCVHTLLTSRISLTPPPQLSLPSLHLCGKSVSVVSFLCTSRISDLMQIYRVCQNPRFPGNLQMSNRQLDEVGENDVNNL